MNPAAAPGVFEEDKSEEEHRIETQQRRLKEGTSELLEQYAELLKSAQIDSNEVAQQVGEVRSAVSAASMVQSGDKLLHLEDELRLSALPPRPSPPSAASPLGTLFLRLLVLEDGSGAALVVRSRSTDS